MNLKKLLQAYFPDLSIDLNIEGLSLDSRQVKPGDLFFAYPGVQTDGRNYIENAINKGAIAILKEGPISSVIDLVHQVPIITYPNIQQIIGEIAVQFYGLTKDTFSSIVGVTGTNGKTSSVLLLAQALHLLGKKVGLISTVGYGVAGEELKPLNCTTPDVLTIHRLLNEFKQQNMDSVIIETSSHALCQGRVTGVPFTLGLFTNLTRDHLDYHGDMKEYAKAKKRLFQIPTLTKAVLNYDDEMGREWLMQYKDSLTVFGYSIKEQIPCEHFVCVKNAEFTSEGITAKLQTSSGSGVIHTQLLGEFNLANILGVVSALQLLEIPLENTINIVSKLQPVLGRMQLFKKENSPLVIIDFAHTPDGLEKALTSARQYCRGKLIVVFGCGGNRDKGKRPIMGKMASEMADRIILTDDNVRFEISKEIVNDILAGITKKEACQILHNRREAIKTAINTAENNDVILIAGKGHERYQIIGAESLPFNEEEIVKEILEKK